ncbi:MAG: PAS domain S-box protein, partial [Planctomycetota bacterium]
MRDNQKTKAELLQELVTLRERVSGLKQVEEALKHSEKQFKELFENAVVGVYRTAPDGRIIMANPELVRMLGYSSFEELSQRNLTKEGFAPQYSRSIFKDLIEREGKVVGQESAWLRRDGTTLLITENARVVRDESGKTLYYEGIVQDITERKKAEEEIEDLAKLASENPNPVLRIGEDGTIIYANEASTIVLETWGCSVGQRIPEPCRERLEECFNSGKVSSFEFTCQNGQIFAVTLAPFVEAGYVNAYGLNITKRKKAEEEIEKFKKMADLATHGCAMADLDGSLVYVNDGFARMHGYAPAELIGKNLEIFHAEAQIKRVGEINKRLVETGQGIQAEEVWHVHRDGTEFPTLMSNWVLKDDNGNLSLICATAIDITERKRAQEALRLRNVAIESSINGVAFVDIQGNLTYVNDSFLKLWGYSDEHQVLGKPAVGFWADPDKAAEIREIVRNRSSWTGELVAKRKDDSIFDVWLSASLVKDENANPVCLMASFLDMTERKKAEEALRESERKYKGLAESLDGVVYRADIETFTATYVNNAVERLYGYSVEEWLSDPNLWEDSIYPDDRERVIAEFTKAQGKSEGAIIKYRIINKDKEVRWVEDCMSWERDQEGKVISMNGIMYDITERKRAEEALVESETRYRTYINNAPDGVFVVDANGKYIEVNEAACRMTGYSSEELLNMSISELLAPTSMEVGLNGFKQLKCKGTLSDVLLLRRRDGTEFYVALDAVKLLGNRFMAYCKDITECKQMEEALRESEGRLRVALSAAQMGTWRWDTVTNQDTRDASLNQILGLEAVESTQPVEDFLGFVHPEDLDMVDEEIQRAIHERRTYVAEFRIIRPDGTVRWLRDQGKPLCDENDRVLCLTGAVIDITNRKKAEEALRYSEGKYRTLIENLPQKIFLKDKNSVFVSCNDNLARDFKIKSEEITGKTDYDFLPKELADKYRADDKRIIESGQTEAIEEKYIQEGEERIVHTVKTPVKDKHGNVVGVLGIFWDITELKQAQEKLSKYRDKMARAEQLASVGTLSATLAHELTQPLTVMRLSIENALEKLETTSSAAAVMKNIKDSLTEVS